MQLSLFPRICEGKISGTFDTDQRYGVVMRVYPIREVFPVAQGSESRGFTRPHLRSPGIWLLRYPVVTLRIVMSLCQD